MLLAVGFFQIKCIQLVNIFLGYLQATLYKTDEPIDIFLAPFFLLFIPVIPWEHSKEENGLNGLHILWPAVNDQFGYQQDKRKKRGLIIPSSDQFRQPLVLGGCPPPIQSTTMSFYGRVAGLQRRPTVMRIVGLLKERSLCPIGAITLTAVKFGRQYLSRSKTY